MSPTIPPEILDLITDHLHDEPTTLKACCIVSKSWVPRTRRHLFSHLKFNEFTHSIKYWVKTFPNPVDSPAHYTHILHLSGVPTITTATTTACAWLHSFRCVVELRLESLPWGSDRVSLVQFKGFSPALRSLRLSKLSAPLPEVLDLIYSFPLLEDLWLDRVVTENDVDQWDPPSTSPRLTGLLYLDKGSNPVARKLSNLPDGPHFSGISVVHSGRDPGPAVALVLRCVGTLKCLSVRYHSPCLCFLRF